MNLFSYAQTLLFALLIFSCKLYGQNTKHAYQVPMTSGPDGFVRCASVEVDAIKRLNNPSLGDIEAFEKWLAPKVEAYKSSSKSDNGVLTIPIVVHVLHNGESVGASPNIPDAQVLSQVTVLNEDFRKILGTNGYNDHPAGADVGLEFEMAQKDPLGNATNGINRVNIQQDGATVDDLENVIKPMTIWDPNKYMNVWAVKFADPDDNLLGYAQFPENSGLEGMPTGTEPANTDGVVIRFEAFGSREHDDGTFILMSNYDLGRTATHEVGHWVGLRHIWGDGLGCNLPVVPPGCSCLFDDFCEDTPNADGANYACDGLEFSTCGVPPYAEMTANYMDYSNDICMNIFTNDQKARVQAVMANSPRRKELVASSNQSPNPFINFATTSSQTPEGSSCNTRTFSIDLQISEAPSAAATVSFLISGTATEGLGRDFTVSPSNVTFPAGSTANQSLTITLSEDAEVEADEFISIAIDEVITGGDAIKGLFDVTHISTIVDDDFPPELAGNTPQVLVFTETFNTLGLGWTETASPGSSVNWKTGTPPLGMIGNYSAYVARTALPGDTYTYDHTVGSTIRLESPIIDASNFSKLSLSFDYICFGEEGYDYGSLWYSTDGSNWTKFGADLNNTPIQTSMTIPLPSETDFASNLQIGFQWDNDELLGIDPPLSFDNIELRGSAGSPTSIQLEVNTDNTYEAYLGPYASANFYDANSNKVLATLTNTSAVDLGCTAIEVDRSSSSANANAVSFWNNQAANELAAKSFYINTENAGGTLEITLYYTQAEINNWEAATGQSKEDLQMVQVKNAAVNSVTPGNHAFDIAVDDATLAGYQNDHRVTATFSGNSGGFGIGVPGSPSSAGASFASPAYNNQIDLPDGQIIQNLYPNPANNRMILLFQTKEGESVDIQLQNRFGQIVFNQNNLDTNKASIQTNHLPNGIYMVMVRSGERVESRKVVVQH